MTTDFFKNIAALNVPGHWKMAIQVDDKGQFTVSALYNTPANGDNAYKVVPPMLLKGTAQEMDEGFFEAIEKPVQETAGLFRNMEGYLKGLEEAKKLSKMEQDKKTAGKPATVKKPVEDGCDVEGDNEEAVPGRSREDLKKEWEEAMKKIGELNDACKYQEALDLLPSAEDYTDKKTELEKKQADLSRKAKQMAGMLQLF